MAEESVAGSILKKFNENMSADPALKQEIARKITDSITEGKVSKDAVEKLLKQEDENS